MSRVAIVFAACIALIVPARAVGLAPVQGDGQGVKSSVQPAACEEPAGQEPTDDMYRWRLRVYRHLDCVMSLVDTALKRADESRGRGGDDRHVTVSRQDLERIRTLALWAKDAAARIGR
jgi:hypothetical protein